MRLRERRTSRAFSSRLYSKPVLINVSRLLLIVVLFWGEVGVFLWSVASCRWPDAVGVTKSVTRLLLLSDPQLQSAGSFFSLEQSRERLYLKKGWHAVAHLRPDVIVFLGDMLAHGKLMKREIDYEHYSQDFMTLFAPPWKTTIHYIPGNNDVGMGTAASNPRALRHYYSKYFQPLNQEVVIQNHRFILLDAPGLVDEDYHRAGVGVPFDAWTPQLGGAIEFVHNKSTSAGTSHQPVILLSHIPLYRPEAASCGSLREVGTIRRGVGVGYQSTLGKQTTEFLLESLHPAIVFSGDNRDYCEYNHITSGLESVREVTVKSFSLSRHIRRPGFQMVTLSDPSGVPSGRSFNDSLCLLPDQSRVYKWIYIPFGLLLCFGLFLLNSRRSRSFRALSIRPIPQNGAALWRSSPSGQSHSTWSPYTIRVPVSPRGTLPTTIRTPHSASFTGPILRATPNPDPPQTSPLLTPMHYPAEEEDSVDSMDHLHYPSHRDGYRDDEYEMGIGNDREVEEPQYEYSEPDVIISKPSSWAWSKSFVFRGRRRRITIRIPPFLSCILAIFDQNDNRTISRNVLYSTLIDLLHVFMPVMLVWALLVWLVYS
ncbi:hypothetical protein BDN72DRAFT_813488 [Pluteus cervinus]|uniref:Uncharacterized protein n=1 Tax=Pluteus cervinus TaxID=181527 RepID=A0ACD3B782_9AGAR|nr:hypothetical protein BDN72DRAFT_813488 [Pluteus cervinus]